MRLPLLMITLLVLAACDDFTPAEKAAVFNPHTRVIDLAQPCPDWSKNSTINATNSNHSNFGCATQNNMAIQLENPADLARGHGTSGPDTETTTTVIENYRSGEIPTSLTPTQTGSAQ